MSKKLIKINHRIIINSKVIKNRDFSLMNSFDEFKFINIERLTDKRNG
jgi:hypothetical protein